ncbi:YCF48-related protein, partial [Rhodocytophaga aerolata]
MRKIYLLLSLLIFFLSFNPVLSQWQKQSNTYGEFSSIAGNSKIVLAATNYHLFYSENDVGGWTNQPEFQSYRNYVFRKGDTFFAQKESDFLVSTDGKTWQKKTGYGYLMAADEYTLLGVAQNKIYSSLDDGNSWQLLPFTLSRYTNIQSLAIAGNYIYVATSEGLYQSKDKGQTWNQLQNLTYDILSVSALGNYVLLATRYHGLIYSIDLGNTWTNINNYANSVITDSQFLSTYLTDNKFIIGSLYTGRIYLSEDKGKTWKNFSAGLPTNAGVDNITIVDDKIIINTVESFNGAIWQRSTAELADDFLVAPTSLTADAYSRDQTLLKWIDNASNEIGFKIERSITDAEHFVEIGSVPKDSTTFKDNNVVNGQTYFYRVRAYNQITHSTYSNQIKLRRLPTTCEDYVNASSTALYDIFFVSSTKGFSVGDFGKLLKTEDGGQNWQDVKHCTYGSYSKIKFTSASLGYATGSWGSMMKTTDGGENWQRLQPPTSRDIKDLFFLNDSLGFIVGENVYKTTDGGISWEKQYLSWDELYSIFFTSETTGFVCGRSNTLYKTTDSGKNWKAIDLNFLGFNKGLHRSCLKLLSKKEALVKK